MSVKLTKTQENILEHVVRCTTSPQRLALRCQIILALANGARIKTYARKTHFKNFVCKFNMYRIGAIPRIEVIPLLAQQ